MRPTHGGNLAWAATLADCSPASILDFSASINPLGPPVSAIRAIKSGLKDLVAYPDPNYYQLREALSGVHKLGKNLTPQPPSLQGKGESEILLPSPCRGGVKLVIEISTSYHLKPTIIVNDFSPF